MDALLNFFSDLILFTAGLGVITLWAFILFAAGIEIYDLIFDEGKSTTLNEDDEDWKDLR